MSAGSGSETFVRPISPPEWLMLAAPDGLVMASQMCVEGDGALDPSAVSAAVAAVAEVCPGSRLVRRGRLWVDSGQLPAVGVVDAAGFDRGRLDSPLLRSPLDTQSGPTCEVILVRGAPTTVIFRTHHGVMDGKGTMFWMSQVFRALRGEAIESATSRLTVDEVMAEVAASHRVDLPPAAGPSGLKWQPLLGNLPSGPRGTMWRRRAIDGTHPAAAAKVVRQVAALGVGTVPVLIPVDLREYLPGLRTTSCAAGTVRVQVRPGDEWSDVQACLLKELNEHSYLGNRVDVSALKAPLSTITSMYLQTMLKVEENSDLINQNGLCDIAAAVSHLGTVNLDNFFVDGFEATSCYSLGSVTFVPAIDIVESQGRTEVTVAWRDGPGMAERVEGLLDRIEEELSPRQHRVWDGNRTERTAPVVTLTTLFEEQVRRSPHAVAVSWTGGELTYAELDERAAGVAAVLRVRGVERNDRVGLVAGRSAEAIVAIMGVLKAGAGYVPLDEGYPDARIRQILTDAGSSVCLLEAPHGVRDCLPAGCEGISLDSVPASGAGWREVKGDPGDLANVIYTSGSTGAPKGVEIEHRSMVNYVRWASREAAIDATVRMPLIASISFDMAGCAIFLPLLVGGTVLPVREVNAVTVREVIEDGGANVMAITPSHLELINQSGIRRSRMRVVMTAGELLRRPTALRAQQVLGPECKILCQWGPTETTIVNTSHEFDPRADTDPGVPFGRPMDNNTVYVIDERGRFVAPGEVGEAYVGGVQVARGYLGRPDLTRQRFVRLADGSRVYRTGDLVCLLPTGELAFVSRIDDQVKVAGHRIEPAEVAQALEMHPGVQQAAVIARSRPGRKDKELCAYVVTVSGTPADGLKEFLAGRLPRYMIPSVILPVTVIPLTGNGKIDTRQLPDPFAAPEPGPANRPARAADRDGVLEAIAGIWVRTLQVEPDRIDEKSDFHQLGGNSILLLSMLNEVFESIVQHGREQFMNELALVIADPTLGRVSDFARRMCAQRPDPQGVPSPV